MRVRGNLTITFDFEFKKQRDKRKLSDVGFTPVKNKEYKRRQVDEKSSKRISRIYRIGKYILESFMWRFLAHLLAEVTKGFISQ